jgi:AcrR family transcriptional regulator
MPANRRTIPRPERVDAIVNAARLRFETQGYKDTSLGDIAKDLKIKPGAIHWYYPTKDDLFAAVTRRIIEDTRAAVTSELGDDAPPMEVLVRFLSASEASRGLHIDAPDRLNESAAVAEVHDEFHRWLDGLLLSIVRPRLGPDQDLELIAEVAHIMFEGLLASTMERDRPFEELVQFLVDMLVATAPQAALAARRTAPSTRKRAD